jgi:tryptophanyl-tRNA synthetase
MQYPTTIVTGFQPTGRMHLGNWAGGLRQLQKLQADHPGQCQFFIADYHAMTVEYSPVERRELFVDIAADILALGLGADPKVANLFMQSYVPEVTELAWILNTVTPISEMERMTQYKDKAARHVQNINLGLLAYPVLQAADILIFGGTHVPVGQDQVQHVEATRVIARSFNHRFGETFPEPKAVLNATPKIRSLVEPDKKMSKSHGPKSYIALSDEPEEILDKVKRVPTEASGLVTPENLQKPEFAGVALLLDLMDLFGATEEKRAVLAESPVKYGNLKKLVAKIISDYFAEHRARKAELLKDRFAISERLEAAGRRARVIAERTMEDVRRKTGLR